MAQKRKTPGKPAARPASAKRETRRAVDPRASAKAPAAGKRPIRKSGTAASAKARSKGAAAGAARKLQAAKAKAPPARSGKTVRTNKTVQANKAVLAKKSNPAKVVLAPKAGGRIEAAKGVPKALPKAAAATPGKMVGSGRMPAEAAIAAARQPVAPRAMPAAVGKPAAPRLTAPAMSKASVTPKNLAEKAAAARQQQLAAAAAASRKPVSQRHGFKTSEFIVYPAHGVGRIVGIEEQEIAGISLELFVIQFEKDKMTLRVPTGKSQSVGMRKLSEDGVVKRAMETLKGKARIKRTMWSRRAQEYEAKINSGDLISIAEVVRDLYRSETQPEQSYSERQLYEAALDRMAREIAAVDRLDERGAMQRITEVLSKSAKGRRMAEEASASEVKAA